MTSDLYSDRTSFPLVSTASSMRLAPTSKSASLTFSDARTVMSPGPMPIPTSSTLLLSTGASPGPSCGMPSLCSSMETTSP